MNDTDESYESSRVIQLWRFNVRATPDRVRSEATAGAHGKESKFQGVRLISASGSGDHCAILCPVLGQIHLANLGEQHVIPVAHCAWDLLKTASHWRLLYSVSGT